MAVAARVGGLPALAVVSAPGRAAAGRLVRAAGLCGVPGERVHVALSTRTMVLPRLAAVERAHEAAELDAGEDELRVVRARRDPTDMRRPRARREAPRRRRRQLPERGELLPRPVAANPERARLAAGVGGAVGSAVGDREDVRRRKLGIAPRRAAVLALENAAGLATGENALAVARVDGNALRAGLLENGVGSTVRDPRDGVAGGDEKRIHCSLYSVSRSRRE